MPSNGARGSNRQGPAQWIQPPRFGFEERPLKPVRHYIISGVTRDSASNPLGNCALEVYETVPGIPQLEPKGRLVNMSTSDANGNYSIEVHSNPGATFQVDAYLPGSPDRAGTTVNTLSIASGEVVVV